MPGYKFCGRDMLELGWPSVLKGGWKIETGSDSPIEPPWVRLSGLRSDVITVILGCAVVLWTKSLKGPLK